MAIAVHSIRSGTNARDAFEPLDIAVDRCKGCGLCVSICPKNVLAARRFDRESSSATTRFG